MEPQLRLNSFGIVILAECCLHLRSGLWIASWHVFSLRLIRSLTSCRLASISACWRSCVLTLHLEEQLLRERRDTLDMSLTRLISDAEELGERHDATDRLGDGVSRLPRSCRRRCRDRARDCGRDETAEHQDAADRDGEGEGGIEREEPRAPPRRLACQEATLVARASASAPRCTEELLGRRPVLSAGPCGTVSWGLHWRDLDGPPHVCAEGVRRE
mmetsp:Transcript_37929/g.109423  ORF Transcript_37929/g.109423 Transcript_37929/m.109423 type:complete len:216 (+) Transcript_37929:787-1434(+)